MKSLNKHIPLLVLILFVVFLALLVGQR